MPNTFNVTSALLSNMFYFIIQGGSELYGKYLNADGGKEISKFRVAIWFQKNSIEAIGGGEGCWIRRIKALRWHESSFFAKISSNMHHYTNMRLLTCISWIWLCEEIGYTQRISKNSSKDSPLLRIRLLLPLHKFCDIFQCLIMPWRIKWSIGTQLPLKTLRHLEIQWFLF